MGRTPTGLRAEPGHGDLHVGRQLHHAGRDPQLARSGGRARLPGRPMGAGMTEEIFLPPEAVGTAPGRGRLVGRRVLVVGAGTRPSPEPDPPWGMAGPSRYWRPGRGPTRCVPI